MTTEPPSLETLSLRGITKSYRGQRAAANDAITLDLEPGELVALIGHNGAGKSTLLNQIAGVTRPDTGSVSLGHTRLDTNSKRARQLTSVMPQLHAPLTGVTPRQALTSIARLRGLQPSQSKSATNGLLRALNIEAWSDTAGQNLSGGLRRLTSYGMAVVAPPGVLLIDEPTNDVDPVRRPLIWRDLRRLAHAGHIVVVVTHNLLEVERHADRCVVLQRGKIIEDSTPQEIATRAGETTLTVYGYRGSKAPSSQPTALWRTFDEASSTLRMALSSAHVSEATTWVLDTLRDELADSYALAPASLETLYEGITSDANGE